VPFWSTRVKKEINNKFQMIYEYVAKIPKFNWIFVGMSTNEELRSTNITQIYKNLIERNREEEKEKTFEFISQMYDLYFQFMSIDLIDTPKLCFNYQNTSESTCQHILDILNRHIGLTQNIKK
jgi:hypothetical protein